MDDPWDVKSVRQTGDYVSLLKINGIPLLPPVLSKECRKEMQYYKLLAKEVEKRISVLQPYVYTDTDSEDKTDAPELPESEQYYEKILTDTDSELNAKIDKLKEATTKMNDSMLVDYTKKHLTEPIVETNRFHMDFSFSIHQTKSPPPPAEGVISEMDLPERDYNYEVPLNMSPISKSPEHNTNLDKIDDTPTNTTITLETDKYSSPIQYSSLRSGPQSKTFTGSLDNLYKESIRNSCTLSRQRSYTLLEPSPVLLAHLEVQSQNTGVEMHCISMSDSVTNLSQSKKRRSWDLESAKAKWSTMALELKQKNINVNKSNKASKNEAVTKTVKRPLKVRAKSVMAERRRGSHNQNTPQSEPTHRARKQSQSPVRQLSNITIVKEPSSPKSKQAPPLPEPNQPQTSVVPAIEDPATKVRELYDKIQQQQLIQMASLVEKQKREQLLLQQVFEEQNNLLFKQLKTICPKSPLEVKEAWTEKSNSSGPVSLSQLINCKSPDRPALSSPDSPTKNANSHKDHFSSSSRKNSNPVSKQRGKPVSNGKRAKSPDIQDGSRTRTHSPAGRNTARKLNYESSAESGRECEILTDRTNDTLADLNVTFPSDSEEFKQNSNRSESISQKLSVTVPLRSTDSAIRSVEQAIHKSMYSCLQHVKTETPTTIKERSAASTIVAYARGYLVRRLMRTERVQTTVQTIKEALLCALQLHQEREGIRGADVDLHRRLIQQITAACYSLHDTFISSTPAERCAMIAADRGRRKSLANKPPHKPHRNSDVHR